MNNGGITAVQSRMSHAPDLAVLRERIRQIETPARHGVLPFGVAALDAALPAGGLALGAVHEIVGFGGDEEDAAASAGFVVGILARLECVSSTLTLPRQRGREQETTLPRQRGREQAALPGHSAIGFGAPRPP